MDVIGGCAGKDLINGSENHPNSAGLSKNANAPPPSYSACIEGMQLKRKQINLFTSFLKTPFSLLKKKTFFGADAISLFCIVNPTRS